MERDRIKHFEYSTKPLSKRKYVRMGAVLLMLTALVLPAAPVILPPEDEPTPTLEPLPYHPNQLNLATPNPLIGQCLEGRIIVSEIEVFDQGQRISSVPIVDGQSNC